MRSALETTLQFAGVAVGASVLVAALYASLMIGAAAVTLPEGQSPAGPLVLVSAWDAALVAAFVWALAGRRRLAAVAAFVLLSLLPLALFLPSIFL